MTLEQQAVYRAMMAGENYVLAAIEVFDANADNFSTLTERN